MLGKKIWDLSYLMNTESSLTPHLYAQDMGLYNVRFYIGFTILMLDLLKYTPLSAMHVIGASNHQPIIHMFWKCPKLLDYLIKIFKTLKDAFAIDHFTNPLLAIFGMVIDVNLSVTVQKALAITTLLARHLILLKWKHVSPILLIHG